jgi:hypothetical protein
MLVVDLGDGRSITISRGPGADSIQLDDMVRLARGPVGRLVATDVLPKLTAPVGPRVAPGAVLRAATAALAAGQPAAVVAANFSLSMGTVADLARAMSGAR